jgi:hypothetical protein
MVRSLTMATVVKGNQRKFGNVGNKGNGDNHNNNCKAANKKIPVAVGLHTGCLISVRFR